MRLYKNIPNIVQYIYIYYNISICMYIKILFEVLIETRQ